MVLLAVGACIAHALCWNNMSKSRALHVKLFLFYMYSYGRIEELLHVIRMCIKAHTSNISRMCHICASLDGAVRTGNGDTAQMSFRMHDARVCLCDTAGKQPGCAVGCRHLEIGSDGNSIIRVADLLLAGASDWLRSDLRSDVRCRVRSRSVKNT